MVEANPPNSDNEFDQDFDKYDRLFHYTSSQGLYGVLESGCLWATHFKYLNDSNEFFAAKKSLTDFVEKEVRKRIAAHKVSGVFTLKDGVTVRSLSEHEASTIVNSLYQATLKSSAPFVFSTFVANSNSPDFYNGKLLHRATYGRDGGYAIGINPHKLAKLLHGKKQNILSQKAVYVRDDPPPELAKEYRIIGESAQEMIDAILHDKFDNIDVGKSAQAFMKVASIIKDAFFEDEREARLVSLRLGVSGEGYVPPTVHVRHSQGRAIPYIKLFELSLLGAECPIESIVIGPHPDRERRTEALKLFLESRGLSQIEVMQSDVPYLGA